MVLLVIKISVVTELVRLFSNYRPTCFGRVTLSLRAYFADNTGTVTHRNVRSSYGG